MDSTLRKAINAGEVMFIDQHLSETVEQLRNQQLKLPDIAVIEAVAITEQGHIVPTTSVGNSASFAIFAKHVIVEINMAHNSNLEGLHDIYIPTYRPTRTPIPLVKVDDRIGSTAIPIPPEKIVAIVITNQPDSPSTVLAPDAETQAIADHLISFFKQEVDAGRMTNKLGPLQAGIGTIANAVMCGLIRLALRRPDDVLRSAAGLDVRPDRRRQTELRFGQLDHPVGAVATPMCSAIWNATRTSRCCAPRRSPTTRKWCVDWASSVSTPRSKFDIYGNVNSTHVCGTRMMNGIGGSGDFARNAHLAIFVTKSIAKGGAISSVVPMVSHVDHTEHDVDILVTEVGLADLRGLAPRERARVIIDNRVHPDYREALNNYFSAACALGGHTPHILRDALSWHINLEETGKMLLA